MEEHGPTLAEINFLTGLKE